MKKVNLTKDELFERIESYIYNLYDIIDYFRNVDDEDNAEYWGKEISVLEEFFKQLKKELK